MTCFSVHGQLITCIKVEHYIDLVFAVALFPLRLLSTRTTITMTVRAAMIMKTTATTPPMMAAVVMSELTASFSLA